MAKYVIEEGVVAEAINTSELISTGFTIDDGNTTISVNCGYKIGNKIISKVYIHGNCHFVLQDEEGNNILVFYFSNTDGKVDNFYYKESEECCIYTWYGRSSYKGSVNMQIQVRLFKNGMFDILQSMSYSNSSAYVTISEASKNITYNLKQNTSYVFYPLTTNGLDYECTVGRVISQNVFYLLEDEGVIKYFNEDLNAYVSTEESAYTKDLFITYGHSKLENTREGIISNEPLVKVYEEKEYTPSYVLQTEYLEDKWYKLELKDFYDVTGIGLLNITSSFTLDEFSDIRCVINKNNEGWFTFNGTEWESIDIRSSDEITNKAMTMEVVDAIPQDKLEGINSFRFALFVKKLDKNSTLKINSIIFNFAKDKIEETRA